MPEIPVQNRSLPSGFCPATYQDMLNGFTLQQFITVDDSSGQWQFSSEKPTDTTKAWWKLDQFGRPEQIYWFAQGAWLSLHPLPPGFVMPWFGDADPAYIKTLDGGADEAASPISGPMWERISTIDAKFPIVAGTLPSGVVIAQGGTGGEEKHILTIAEMPAHHHGLTRPTRADTGTPSWEEGDGADFTAQTEDTGGGQSHNNLPPYVGMCFLMRTVRKFYRV